MRCSECKHWLLEERTIYGDGTVMVIKLIPSDGIVRGKCRALNMDTVADFGCNRFVAGTLADQEIVTHKEGAPWQNSHAGPCPDCNGKGNSGDGACHRCAGTSKVRYYDDGYIGEEQTREHPKEREIRLAQGRLPEIDPGTILQPLPKESAL
jgi:hypothetical protein